MIILLSFLILWPTNGSWISYIDECWKPTASMRFFIYSFIVFISKCQEENTQFPVLFFIYNKSKKYNFYYREGNKICVECIYLAISISLFNLLSILNADYRTSKFEFMFNYQLFNCRFMFLFINFVLNILKN